MGQCDYISKSRETLSRHKSNKHSIRTKTTFVCDQCSYTSKQKGHLDIHIRSKHQGELIKCDMCDYKATQLSNLVRHKRSKHLVEEALPKAQRTRGLSSSCQSHIASSNANLDRISSSLRILTQHQENISISTKHKIQNLDPT